VAPREIAPPSDEARRLVALLQLRRDEFADLRTLAEVTIRRGVRIQRFTGVLLVKPPAWLRFEALSPFGQPFLLLTISGGMLSTFNVAENLALSGPVNERTTGRWLGVPLEAEDLVGLLIGRVPPGRGFREAEVLPPDADGPSLRLAGEHRRRRLWMDFETGEVHKAEIGGRTTLVVIYARNPGAPVPRDIHATAGPDFEAQVHYQEPAIATGISEERFVLQLPMGANVQRFH
jgi:hypothetical protein